MISEKQIKANTEALSFALELLDFVKTSFYPKFTLTTRFDWAVSRRSSRGGIYKDGPGINMAMHSAALIYHDPRDVYRFYEYPSYDSDATIGGFYSKNYSDKLRALVAHEVAHAVQYYEYSETGIRCKPHGPVFKKYYSIFRQKYINNTLGNQIALKSEYEKYFPTNSYKLLLR